MRNGVEILLPLASLFALALGAAVAGPAMLGSMGWRGQALHFKGNRINPLSGLKRMFGMQGATELGQALATVQLLGAIGYWLVKNSQRGRPSLRERGGQSVELPVEVVL